MNALSNHFTHTFATGAYRTSQPITTICVFTAPQVVKGSSKLFQALLDRCLARDVVAVCRYIPRKNAQPFFVGLVPQAERLDDNNLQVEPPGFHVVFLPFAEDFRTLHLEECTKGKSCLHVYTPLSFVHNIALCV